MATVSTGLLGEGLRGKVGGAVFQQMPTGTTVRDLVVPRDPQTPEQIAFRQRQGRAALVWSDLDPAVTALWAAYAKTAGMRPMNAFTTLYGRLLRLNPAAPVPLSPPSRPFFGDVVTIEFTPNREAVVAATWVVARLGEIAHAPTEGAATSPSDLAAGALVFSASGPNAPGIVTELLLQPLASRNRRTYKEKYRHAAFVAFDGIHPASVTCEVGWVACAYRFVNANTGQATEIAELGVVRVD